MQHIITEYPQYFTATNLEWKRLLKPDKYKKIVIESLKFMVKNDRIKLFAFFAVDEATPQGHAQHQQRRFNYNSKIKTNDYERIDQ